MKKSIVFVLVVTMLLFTAVIPQKTYATNLTTISNGAENFINQEPGKKMFNEENEKNFVDSMYWIMLGIALAVAVIVGLILSIQYITSGVEGKAKYKEKLVPYGVGVVVALGAFGIWRLVLELIQKVFN